MAERVVVIGGDPGGMTAVSRIRALRPDVEIVVLERGRWTSYSACGIPYLVGGEITGGVEALIARSVEQHRGAGTDVRIGHEVVGIDVARSSVDVEVRGGAPGPAYRLGFDQLLIATGGAPIRPRLPGIDLPFVHGVQTLDDAQHLLEHAEAGCRRTVVVGSGYIGLEMAEAFANRGCTSVVLDRSEQPMSTLDPDMGALVATAMRAEGVDLRCGVEVTGFEPGAVLTGDGRVEADLVVLGIGVRPNSALAAAAGMALGAKDSIRVDRRQETSVPGVWAAGDCCESHHRVTGRGVHIALGTHANKQSRVAGINIGGGDAVFPGVVGTAITKLCRTEIARTGLGEREAAEAGFDAISRTIEATTVAGYLPHADHMTVKVIAERGTGRLLGAQIVGGAGAAKRIDTCATAITATMTVQDVVDLDLAYAPPFSGVWDPVAVAAREALKAV